jgi:hypothetical protein
MKATQSGLPKCLAIMGICDICRSHANARTHPAHSSLPGKKISPVEVERQRDLFPDRYVYVRRRQNSHGAAVDRLDDDNVFLAMALDRPDFARDRMPDRPVRYPHVLGTNAQPVGCPALTCPLAQPFQCKADIDGVSHEAIRAGCDQAGASINAGVTVR